MNGRSQEMKAGRARMALQRPLHIHSRAQRSNRSKFSFTHFLIFEKGRMGQKVLEGGQNGPTNL